MKKVNKAKVILRAFTKESTIDKDILADRRAKCDGCPRNSKNVDPKTMGLKDMLQHQLGKPFCTICSCFIEEKTSQETEECALSEIGKNPLWNRLKIETAGSTDLNIINYSPDKISVDLDEDLGSYSVIYNPMKKDANTNIRIALEKDNKEVKIQSMNVSCSCLEPVQVEEDGKSYIDLRLDLTLRPLGPIRNKYIEINYTLDSQPYFLTLNVLGEILK